MFPLSYMRRAETEDLSDAMEYVVESYPETDIDPAAFSASPSELVPVDSLWEYDDVSSWLDMEEGELSGMSREDLVQTLAHFRGVEWARLAMYWLDGKSAFPPIVIIDGPNVSAVGDGRGRVNLAIGMGWDEIPAVFMRPKRSTQMRHNPPWADRILYDNWKAVATFSKKHGLPVPTPGLLPSRKVVFEEFGCGKYGCAYPTKDPAIVCKLTSDVSEAAAVQVLSGLQGKPGMDGIVKFYGLMPLKGKHAPRGEKATLPIHLIWREGADCSTELEEFGKKQGGEINTAWQLLFNSAVAANRAKNIYEVQPSPAAFLAQVLDELAEARELAQQTRKKLLTCKGSSYIQWNQDLAEADGPAGMAYCLEAFRLILGVLKEGNVLDVAATTLLTCLDRDILLADVHDQNVCLVDRGNGPKWVVIDPGQMIVLGQKPLPRRLKASAF
jgi:hypothetical protein